MLELPLEFIGKGEVSGFYFKQINRTRYAYIYQVNDRHFEVFEHREQKYKETIIDGEKVIFEEKILYPGSWAFGDWAFTFVKYENAIKKFNRINKRYENQ